METKVLCFMYLKKKLMCHFTLLKLLSNNRIWHFVTSCYYFILLVISMK